MMLYVLLGLGACSGAVGLGALVAAAVVGRRRGVLLAVLLGVGVAALALCALSCLATGLLTMVRSETSYGGLHPELVTAAVEHHAPSETLVVLPIRQETMACSRRAALEMSVTVSEFE